MSGNYQSRVFTFISKRTNRLKDTCAQGLRHIKVAVVWGGQILLYPIQLLAQTTKIFQPQFTAPAQKPVLPPVPDINIEQALELLVDAGYPILFPFSPRGSANGMLRVGGASPQGEQRGSANVIVERGSVNRTNSRGGSLERQAATGKVTLFANEDSSSLGYYDPDTDDWEVASYSPRRSQQVVAKKPVIQGLSSLLVDRQLVLVTTENEILDILTSSQQQEIRRRIGIDLAIDWYQWHTGEILDRHSPVRVSPMANRLSLNHQASTEQLAISSSEDRSTPNLFERWQDWLKSLTAKSAAATIQSNNFATEQIEQIESKLPRQIAPASYSFIPQPPQIDRFLDLPQLPPINEIELPADRDNSIQATFTKLQPEWLKQWWSYYRDYLSIPTEGFDEADSSQIIIQPAEFQLTQLDRPSENRIEKILGKSSTRDITHNQHQPQQNSGKLDHKIFQDVEYNPDWIEAEAERVGYSKSPIAKLLEWIDIIILQIENWLIKIWNILQNHSV
jgi:hypothetical protein